MKKLKTIITVVVIFAIIGYALVSVVKSKIGLIDKTEDIFMQDMMNSYTVKYKDFSTCIRSSGSVTSFNIETLDIEMGSKVTEILVNEGDKVNSKQDILKITDMDGKTKTIKSTISGMFFCIESPTEGTKYCIYSLDDVGVKVPLAEKDIVTVKLGQKTKVKIEALNKEFEGTVNYISSLPQNEKYVVKIKIDYTDELKFGYKASTSIITNEKENVMVIPYDCAYLDENNKYYVLKEEVLPDISDDIYEYWVNFEAAPEYRTYIEVGDVNSQNIEILSGLNEGDKILIKVF